MVPTDRELERVLAEVAGVEVRERDGTWFKRVVFGGVSHGGVEHTGEHWMDEWTPLTDHNQMAMVKAGVPDLFLPVARHRKKGLFIEMKAPKKGVVSEEQMWWLMELNKQGYETHVCRGAQEAIEVLSDYVGMEGDT